MFFFFNDTATTEIYTLSLHDALPILKHVAGSMGLMLESASPRLLEKGLPHYNAPDKDPDRKSTRLNSSHANISYAVFCLKKKNIISISNTTEHNYYKYLLYSAIH